MSLLKWVFAGLVGLFVLGWAFYSFGIVAPPEVVQAQIDNFILKYQWLAFWVVVIGGVVVGYLYFSKEGHALWRIHIPEQSARPFSKVWGLAEDDEDAGGHHDFLTSNLQEFYGPPLFTSSGLKEGGLYYGFFETKGSYVPRGWSRVMIGKFLPGIVSKPFMETKSKLVELIPYDQSFVFHRARKGGDAEYETLGADSGAYQFINKLLEKHPELAQTLNLAAPLQEAVRVNQGGK